MVEMSKEESDRNRVRSTVYDAFSKGTVSEVFIQQINAFAHNDLGGPVGGLILGMLDALNELRPRTEQSDTVQVEPKLKLETKLYEALNRETKRRLENDAGGEVE